MQDRPLSPHLTIYKPQISSVLSIMHRMSGFVIFTVTIMLIWWFALLVFNKFDPCYFKLFEYPVTKILLFAFSLAFFYHMLNGIRHLIWDVGIGYSKNAVIKSGIFTLITTIILTIGFWIILLY